MYIINKMLVFELYYTIIRILAIWAIYLSGEDFINM